MKRENIEIKTAGQLKELLNKFEDGRLLNFGTDKEGFEIDSYGFDGVSVSLISSDLQEFIKEIK